MPQKGVRKILGSSGVTFQGLIVQPIILDGDSKKEIKIMAYVREEMQIDALDKIAQLLLFPYIKSKATPVKRKGPFGSTRDSNLANNG